MAESKATFRIRGVESESDVEGIEDALQAVEGVMGTRIDPDGDAEIRYDEDLVSGERVKDAVREEGYDVA